MIKAQEDINRLNEILKKARNKTPSFLNGLLIPRWDVEDFYIILHRLMDKAKASEEYFKLMWEGEKVREKMKFDMVSGLVKMASKGMFGSKKKEVSDC